MLDLFEPAGEAAIAEFKEWFDRADRVRALRNDYVHGRWGVPGKYNFRPPGGLTDAEPLLTVVALNWNMEPNQPDQSITMTIKEFEAQVKEADDLFSDYRNLSEKYMRHMKM